MKYKVKQLTITNGDLRINWDTRMNSPIIVTKIVNKRAYLGRGSLIKEEDGERRITITWDSAVLLTEDESLWLIKALDEMYDCLIGTSNDQYWLMNFAN